MIPGIDLAGTVEASSNPSFKVGDKVVLNGYEAGVTHNGGLAQRARVKGDWLVKVPENITTRQAAAIGTAGYAAMLCVLALERGGVCDGDILVTGAAGGVGSVASHTLVNVLAQTKYGGTVAAALCPPGAVLHGVAPPSTASGATSSVALHQRQQRDLVARAMGLVVPVD